MKDIRVSVPATSANLGPGFDCLGLALNLYNEFYVASSSETSVAGCEAGTDGPDNLFLRAYRRGLSALDLSEVPIRTRFAAKVPMARGLGSSSTCIVGGLLAASAVAAGALERGEAGAAEIPEALPRSRVLDLAAEMEGHPDNVAPALLGGFVVSTMDSGRVVSARSAIGGDLGFHALVPPFPLETSKARAALPQSVAHRDAAFNAGRSALVAAAFLSRQYELLGAACADRLHEPYRAPLIPGFAEIVAAARAAGALATFLSGAGPTIMAVCRVGDAEFPARMKSVLSSQPGGAWTLHSLAADDVGATLSRG